MPDHNHARMMLSLARKDLKALKMMTDEGFEPSRHCFAPPTRFSIVPIRPLWHLSKKLGFAPRMVCPVIL